MGSFYCTRRVVLVVLVAVGGGEQPGQLRAEPGGLRQTSGAARRTREEGKREEEQR